MAVYMKVKHLDYENLVKKCDALEKENKKLKAELEKVTAKTKKGGKE